MMQWIHEIQLLLNHFWEACQTPYHLGMTLLAVLLILFLWIKIKRRTRVLLINDGAQGRVEVAQSALEELVFKACEEFASRPKVSFKLRSNQVEVFLQLKLKANLPLNTTACELQEKVNFVLKNHLSEEAIRNVHVCVTGFKGEAHVPTIEPLISSLEIQSKPKMRDENQSS